MKSQYSSNPALSKTKSILPPPEALSAFTVSHNCGRWFPRIFLSVAARWSPPVDWRLLICSSVMSISNERSVEFPQRQTIVYQLRSVNRDENPVSKRVDGLCVSSWNMRRSFSAVVCSSNSVGNWPISANRMESSNTASFEREKVSHFVERLSSMERR